ncbi:putative AlkP superfamily pyrophosphatase or phosphodiesterase [Sporomusaceae bacterium BoRhaA]|uniref:alkaline phosphatase family protein n=1 Tax=Pelorhabdus rhamnosifermentans TaxID=2772457 RepID=UPI001C05EE98|nr:ectonucleotide pyrophosphatase/phosphodiesterase [Pelorhabdus rhamnosifermentans]MBU2703710.1 putative AlkP superfamily pyrophosphatase or phosphodiesterase [Pelorhabdus rhamnosifermentans]
MKKRLVVLCVDSLFTNDIKDIEKLPHFHQILQDSIIAPNITCVYPTLTYPCHAAIMSGCYPDNNGILHNEKLNPATDNADWYWYYQDLKVPSLFDYAKENHLSTASVLWPVSVGAPVDYLIPEIWLPHRDDTQDILEETISDSVQEIYHRNKHLCNWKINPEFDIFAAACTVDIIHEFKPDILFVHMASLDHYRHAYGTHADNVQVALKLHDQWLGMILDALKTENLAEETAFVLLGDHGQMSIEKNICLNHLFREKNLLTVNNAGTITDYKAYAQSCGISAQVYVKQEKDQAEVLDILTRLKQDDFLRDIFTAKETREKFHLSGDFSFVVEAPDFSAFSNAHERFIIPTQATDYKYNVSTHGHLPDRGEKPCFIIHNSGYSPQVIKNGRLIDEAPTILALLGIEMKNIDGRSLL